MEQNVSRRGFIGAAIGTGAAAAISTPAFAHKRGHGHGHGHGHHGGRGGSVPRNRRSSQLYSWRRIMDRSQSEAERMLRALSQMGYTQVERAGTYGWTAQQFKRVLDRYDLWAHSSHDGFSIDPDNDNWLEEWKPAVAYANELDQKFIGFAWFPGPYNEKAFWQFLADRFDQAGEYAKSQGLQFFYHNHDFEFVNKFDGKPAYDILLNETDSKFVKFELDLYWIVYGGESPVHYVSADPARFPLYHVKDRTWRDRGPTVQDWEDVGPGSIDFPDIFDAGDGRGLDKHYVIEHDQPQLSHPGDENAEFKTAATGVEYLKNVRW
jgi:sugar phosphate isomerase/epimerase